jgi:hypothetical protein
VQNGSGENAESPLSEANGRPTLPEFVKVVNNLEDGAKALKARVTRLLGEQYDIKELPTGVTLDAVRALLKDRNDLHQQLDSSLNGLKHRAGVPLTRKDLNGMPRASGFRARETNRASRLGEHSKRGPTQRY